MFAQAAQLLGEFPYLDVETGCFNVRPSDLVAALKQPATFVPPAFMATADTPPRKKNARSNGGWFPGEIEFPGDPGRCEVAEVDGAVAAASPLKFLREFLVKKRPVIVRDFMRHDSGLRELSKLMTSRSIVASMGKTTWDIATIPYPTLYDGAFLPAKSLEEYMNVEMKQSISNSSSFRNAPPPYIFSTTTSRDRKEVETFFPHRPALFQSNNSGLIIQ